MCTYEIYKTNKKEVALYDSVWDLCRTAKVNCVNWKNWAFAPKTECSIIAVQDGFYVRFKTEDKPFSVCTNFNDPTCMDSCAELFINFAPQDREEYFNFELNSNGAMLLEFGKPGDRKHITDVDPSIFRIETVACEDGWEALFFIPGSFIQKFYGNEIGGVYSGNIYKCGDKTPTPHYLTWAPIKIPKPDFHRPDYFGKFIITEEK